MPMNPLAVGHAAWRWFCAETFTAEASKAMVWTVSAGSIEAFAYSPLMARNEVAKEQFENPTSSWSTSSIGHMTVASATTTRW